VEKSWYRRALSIQTPKETTLMIDEKDPNDETPSADEPNDATPRTDGAEPDAEADSKVSDDDLDDASGGGFVRQ
jgi:hypothetical protein